MRTKIYISILLLLALIATGFTQPADLFLRYLQKKLTEYNMLYPAEKAYLHTDKTFYKPGDDIWVAAYLLDGVNHRASDISNVLYVELIDPKGVTIKQHMFQVEDGKCEAHLHLPYEAPGGLYKLKAYTKWMSNFGSKFTFEKKLQVQKIVKPRILSILDFTKEAYGASDTVMANLNVRDLSNVPIRNQSFSFMVHLKGNLHQRGKATTDHKGDAIIRFVLPQKLNSSDGVLNVLLSHRGRNESISGAIPIVLNKLDLQFMPEGGDAIAGQPCRMAFKALNEFGKPADVKGQIYNSKDSLVANFESFHQGMGAFEFVPVIDEVYSAVIQKPSGVNRRYTLPKAQTEGCALHLKDRDGSVYRFELNSNVTQKVHVVAHLRGQMLYSESYNLKGAKQVLPITIEKKGLSGVAQITVFDDYERPLAERLFYVFPENRLSIELKTNKKTYAPREKVEMELQVNDAKGNPVEGNFSLAVVDDKLITFADDKQDNILSNLLLSSDLKGEIYEPSFYFNPKEEKAAEAIDYLLLTQGWRRFNWSEVLHMKKIKLQEPERFDQILGQITSNAGKGVKAKVVIVDDQLNKFAKITTEEGGRFSVSGLKNYKMLQVYAFPLNRKERNIRINISRANPNIKKYSADSHVGFGKVKVTALTAQTEGVDDVIEMAVADEDIDQVISGTGIGFAMEEESVALEEVVLMGYGSSRKSDLTGAVTRVVSDELQGYTASVNSALSGNVAGVQVINDSGIYGSRSSVSIRGSSSLTGNSQPLYILDGVPVTGMPPVQPNEIESISILKGATSTALYGSRAANGVIIINTKEGYHELYHRTRKYARKMVKQYVANSFVFDNVKEFYVPQYGRKEFLNEKLDKRETIYWNPLIKTNKKGKAKVVFYNSDEVTTFRATLEGFSEKGLLGRTEYYYNVVKPLSIECKIPPYVVFEDIIRLPVLITNNSDVPLEGTLDVKLPESWQWVDTPPAKVQINANGFAELVLAVKVGAAVGKESVKLNFDAGSLKAEDINETQVVSKGFPAEMSYSARAKEASFTFDLSQAVNQSTEMSISVYNNVLAEIMDGIESVIRQPHGCFEQVSAATYPNILILKYLEENGELSDELKGKTLSYIRSGYKKLAAYETKDYGFEWFGKTPPHEGLTAFGLMEFYDMMAVYADVDANMLKRTRQWLLSRKDGKGGFVTNKGKYGFSGASDKVTAAYLVYAFSEVGIPPEKYQLEYDKAWNEAFRSKDAYRMALMANAGLNRKDQEKATQLINVMLQKLKNGKVEKLKADHSIVRSWGKSLQVEVAALTALALMKQGDQHFTEVMMLMDYIFGARSYGGFGSTQATVLALKAITEYASIVNKMPEDGSLIIRINGREVATKAIKSSDKIVKIDGLEDYLTNGVQKIDVRFNNLSNPLSFSANASWRQKVPVSSNACKVQIETKLMKETCKKNELVRLSTRLFNRSMSGLPMTVAMVGIPSGLSAQPWQLKKMQEEHVFDYYEIHKNYVVFYYRELGPNARKTIHLDLKAEVPGQYSSPASCAYLYYTNEHKDWHMAGNIEIME
ncbi:MAG: TonB-dependent receptor plug domain-containing protein [Carboxylicivirga sp.]|jgi:TonB-dependent SusC/RagA subfamily outer membrane receptor|nr:TonB-dependent receptor plug domain-containing protein [Carboxylicivirga sp.]